MKSLKFLAALAATGFSLGARADDPEDRAGFYIEPGVSYQVTESSIDYPTGLTNTTAATRGAGAILRGGMHVWDQFFIGADARYALLEFRDNANGLSSDATSWDVAPVVGWQMADSGPRLYVEYVLAGDLDPEGNGGYDFRLKEAKGWRVGAGLKVKSISVNLEWQRLEYDKTDIENFGPTTANAANNNFRNNGLVASVTFPFAL